MDIGLVHTFINEISGEEEVLILVVVDIGLVPRLQKAIDLILKCLNPCCSGHWSRTLNLNLTVQNVRTS